MTRSSRGSCLVGLVSQGDCRRSLRPRRFFSPLSGRILPRAVLRSLTSGSLSLDKAIPNSILRRAKALVLITHLKVPSPITHHSSPISRSGLLAPPPRHHHVHAIPFSSSTTRS